MCSGYAKGRPGPRNISPAELKRRDRSYAVGKLLKVVSRAVEVTDTRQSLGDGVYRIRPSLMSALVLAVDDCRHYLTLDEGSVLG
jgi:hypothetical protein